MGLGYSSAAAQPTRVIMYDYPSVEAAVASVLLRHVPGWEKSVCYPSEANIDLSHKTDYIVFLGYTPDDSILKAALESSANVFVFSHNRPMDSSRYHASPNVTYMYSDSETSLMYVYNTYIRGVKTFEFVGAKLDGEPWWLNQIDRYDRGISEETDSTQVIQQLLLCPIKSAKASDEKITKIVTGVISLPEKTLVTSLSSEFGFITARIHNVVKESKIQKWTLPPEVTKVKTEWPVVYIELESPFDSYETANECWRIHKRSEVKACILRFKNLIPGQTSFYFVASTPDVELKNVLRALGNTNDQYWLHKPGNVEFL